MGQATQRAKAGDKKKKGAEWKYSEPSKYGGFLILMPPGRWHKRKKV